MLESFARTQLLLGPEAMEKLARSRVAVFGIGGVGSFAAEALARSGVGAIDLIDHDDISITNLNRQVMATMDDLGMPKVEAMARRIGSIDPACEVRTHRCFYLPKDAHSIDLAEFTYVIDAVDTITGKLLIIEEAQRVGTPVISSMGTANKLDPTAFRVADIYQTSICPLAKVIRKECRKRGISRLKVVYSTEPVRELYPRLLGDDVDPAHDPDAEAERQSRHGIPGSCAFVSPVAGLIAAGEVIKDIAGIDESGNDGSGIEDALV